MRARQIASHLRPIDVFHLSHASKQLRKMLFSRTARFVWEVARGNLDPPLPKCPVDMSEPMYAYLVFGQYCMVRRHLFLFNATLFTLSCTLSFRAVLTRVWTGSISDLE